MIQGRTVISVCISVPAQFLLNAALPQLTGALQFSNRLQAAVLALRLVRMRAGKLGIESGCRDAAPVIFGLGLIKQRLSESQTTAQIEAYFVEQYGERVLGAPRAQGFNLLIYVLPAFAVSAGAAGVYLFAQRRIALTPSASAACSLCGNS